MPPDASDWPPMPEITVRGLREAIAKVPARTAVGCCKLHPRSLQYLSDNASEAVAAMLACCEKCLSWPPQRLVSRLFRLGKPDGGHRLIALLDSLVRV